MSRLVNNIGNNIRCLRRAYGETQSELSSVLGLESPNTISNYERGDAEITFEIKDKNYSTIAEPKVSVEY